MDCTYKHNNVSVDSPQAVSIVRAKEIVFLRWHMIQSSACSAYVVNCNKRSKRFKKYMPLLCSSPDQQGEHASTFQSLRSRYLQLYDTCALWNNLFFFCFSSPLTEEQQNWSASIFADFLQVDNIKVSMKLQKG